MKKVFTNLYIFFFFFNIINAQKFIADTVYIPFGLSDVPRNINATLKEITDKRQGNNIIFIGEKKKYFYLQTDVFTATKKPIKHEIENSFRWDSTQSTPLFYSFEILEFKTEPLSGSNTKGSILYSKIQVIHYNIDNKKTDTLGILMHETIDRKYKKSKKINPYQPVIENWKKEFSSDVGNISTLIRNNEPVNLYNLYKGNTYPRNYFIPSVSAFIGFNNFIFDAELLYARPETTKKFYRHTSLLRYRNSKDFEALEFPIRNEEINFRINRNYVFTLSTAGFIGINRWKDMKEIRHTLFEIVLFDWSASQMVSFNKMNQKSLVAGFGLMETFHYIIPKTYGIDIGLKAQIGIKL